MPSAALRAWESTRTERIDHLRDAHRAYGGSAPGRRWVTEELNHALVLRLASEFQGFARDLHDEAGLFITRALAPGNLQLQATLRIPYTANRKLSRGNANPSTLTEDFGLFGISLWAALDRRYPRLGPTRRTKLEALNKARNAIAHDEPGKLAQLKTTGWPMTLESVDRWKSALDGLTAGIDVVVGDQLRLMYGTAPW